jgi:hypothetical protein
VEPPAGVVEIPPNSGNYFYVDSNGQPIIENGLPKRWYPPAEAGWVPGGDNTSFYATPELGFTSQMFWQDYIIGRLEYDMSGIAAAFGEDKNIWTSILLGNSGPLLGYLDEIVWHARQGVGWGSGMGGYQGTDPEQGMSWLEGTAEGREQLYMIARNWLTRREARLISGYETYEEKLRNSRSSGGYGSGVSADSFDLDQLSLAATNAWRAYLLEEPPDARGIARAYVDAYLKNPNQRLDFDTFVINRIKESSRYAQVYANKPAGMDELEFNAPFVAAATQLLRPENVNPTAVAGMRLAGSQEAYGSLLLKQREVVTSSPFMQRLEQRLSNLRTVLG